MGQHDLPPLVAYSSSEESAICPSPVDVRSTMEMMTPGAVVVPTSRLMARQRHIGGAADVVLLRDRLELHLGGGRFLTSDGLSTDGIIDGMLLRNEVGVRRGHGRHGLLARPLAVDLALRQLVLL